MHHKDQKPLQQLLDLLSNVQGLTGVISGGNLKAIGGVRVKKIMLILSYRTPQGRTEAFYRIKIFDYVQKLSQFEVRNFGRNSYKKMR